jgi:hypothetical protein
MFWIDVWSYVPVFQIQTGYKRKITLASSNSRHSRYSSPRVWATISVSLPVFCSPHLLKTIRRDSSLASSNPWWGPINKDQPLQNWIWGSKQGFLLLRMTTSHYPLNLFSLNKTWGLSRGSHCSGWSLQSSGIWHHAVWQKFFFEDGHSMFLYNIGTYLLDYITSIPRKQ